MRKEIGSEFWEVPVCDSKNFIFPENASYFISGRSALYYIIEDILKNHKIRTVALPSWCCDSMITPFLEFNMTVKFYSVLKDDEFYCDFSDINNCDILFLMDYFGYDCRFKKEDFDGIIIRDLTHSVFTKKYNDAHYYFGSLRKWAGFFTGGFAWKKDGCFKEIKSHIFCENYISMRKKAMEEKKKYIFKKSQSKDYLKMFNDAEDLIEKDIYSYFSESSDIEKIKYLDIDLIKKKRRENAQYLLNELKSIAIFPKLQENDCPLFVPVIIDNGRRDSLRKYLIENEIYAPVHWQISKFHNITNKEKYIYDNELSIVCDQRYNEQDMQRTLDVINKFMEE